MNGTCSKAGETFTYAFPMPTVLNPQCSLTLTRSNAKKSLIEYFEDSCSSHDFPVRYTHEHGQFARLLHVLVVELFTLILKRVHRFFDMCHSLYALSAMRIQSLCIAGAYLWIQIQRDGQVSDGQRFLVQHLVQLPKHEMHRRLIGSHVLQFLQLN